MHTRGGLLRSGLERDVARDADICQHVGSAVTWEE